MCFVTSIRYRLFDEVCAIFMGFPGGTDGKESACHMGDPGSILGLGISPVEGNGTHFSIFDWRIPWTEKPGEAQSMGSQRAGHSWMTNTHMPYLFLLPAMLWHVHQEPLSINIC